LQNSYIFGSIAVKIPLTRSKKFGYEMLSDIPSVLKQNLKTLILTVPGERVMTPDYGVGAKRFLFENFSDSVFSQIDSNLREQVTKYMPMIEIMQVRFDNASQDNNLLYMSIAYSIPGYGIADSLSIPIKTGQMF